ncbi:MAG: S8 family peptidase [Prevotellaceae bacterium]|jgi:subtilisin family serine protease|nr:S8 family peptidase [Prevotellaceae bacterium]
MGKSKILLISALLLSNLLCGQTNVSKMSPATRIFLKERAICADSANRNSLKSRFLLKSVDNVEYIGCLIKLHDTSNLDDLLALGVRINTVLSQIITARVPVNQLEAVATLPNVERLEISNKAYPLLDKARESTNVDKSQSGLDLPNSTPFTGKDVVVGVIDGGFEYGHINFYDTLGTTLRVKCVWNQDAYSGTHPLGYTYGTEYKTETSILNARYDMRYETHATHVTGIAAGAYKGLNHWGVAPEADIVMVSYSDNLAEDVSLIDGINYIYTYAASVNKPAVANMSLGYHVGPHDGTSLFDLACDDLQGAGKLLCGAAGNEGNTRLHIAKTFAVVDTLKTFITVPSGYGMDYSAANFWGEPNKNMKIQFVIFNKTQRKILFASNFYDASQYGSYVITLNDTTGASGDIYLETEKYSANNKPAALFQTSVDFTVSTGNILGIRIISQDGATVNGWTVDNISYFTNNSLPASLGWTNGDTQNTVGEIGGTGNRIISVGAYSSKTQWKQNNSSYNQNTGETLNNIASFSSKGPRVDGIMKPDITAPGTILISSFNGNAATSGIYSSYVTNIRTVGGKDYYFGAMEGTSMAAPFVTGVLATWLQANPQLTPEDVREIFSQTAIVDAFTGATPNNTWGYGKIDAWAGLLKIFEMMTINENAVNQPLISIVNPIESTAQITFKYNDNDVNLYLMDMNGKLIFVKKLSQVSENQLVIISETANLPAGNYIFYFKGKTQSGVWKILKK